MLVVDEHDGYTDIHTLHCTRRCISIGSVHVSGSKLHISFKTPFGGAKALQKFTMGDYKRRVAALLAARQCHHCEYEAFEGSRKRKTFDQLAHQRDRKHRLERARELCACSSCAPGGTRESLITSEGFWHQHIERGLAHPSTPSLQASHAQEVPTRPKAQTTEYMQSRAATTTTRILEFKASHPRQSEGPPRNAMQRHARPARPSIYLLFHLTVLMKSGGLREEPLAAEHQMVKYCAKEMASSACSRMSSNTDADVGPKWSRGTLMCFLLIMT